MTTSPPTVTRPLAMIFSAMRREATPPWARNFASRTAQSCRRPHSARCSPGLEQPLAQLALVLGAGVEARRVGQLVEPGEAEEALEQLRGLEDRGAEPRAARLLDQAALGQASAPPTRR